MADEAGKSRLGRGLAALIGDVGAETPTGERGRNLRRIPIEFIKPNPRNPRRSFSEAELAELTDSIRERGIIQPIVVRLARGKNDPKSDSYEIIAGERRWRAAQRAGLREVPIALVEATDEESLEFAIIENVQRADLNPIEEAMGYQLLADEFRRSQDDIAKIVGKSRSHVANTLRLLRLPESVKAHLLTGALTAGHARMLVGQPNAEALATEIVERGLNVRQVETLARHQGSTEPKQAKTSHPIKKDADIAALEKRLSDALGLAVTIDHRGANGTLRIEYRALDQLDEVIRRLTEGG